MALLLSLLSAFMLGLQVVTAAGSKHRRWLHARPKQSPGSIGLPQVKWRQPVVKVLCWSLCSFRIPMIYVP